MSTRLVLRTARPQWRPRPRTSNTWLRSGF